jgi:inorganic pyrophosphatase
VIETPKRSPNKYSYDPDLGCFTLGKTLPDGMSFPFDFGFIPSTLGDDGDPLDILVLMDFPAVMGCLAKARLLGVIQSEQKDKGKNWQRNDRFVAVAEHSRVLADMRSLGDLRSGLVDEITAFFAQYNAVDGKRFRSLALRGEKQARALIETGRRRFKR